MPKFLVETTSTVTRQHLVEVFPDKLEGFRAETAATLAAKGSQHETLKAATNVITYREDEDRGKSTSILRVPDILTASEPTAEAPKDPAQEMSDQKVIRAWREIADHPFFKECYDADDSLLNAMLAKLTLWHENSGCVNCALNVNVPRVITADELREGQWAAVKPEGSDQWRVGEVRASSYFANTLVIGEKGYMPTHETVLLADAPEPEPTPELPTEPDDFERGARDAVEAMKAYFCNENEQVIFPELNSELLDQFADGAVHDALMDRRNRAGGGPLNVLHLPGTQEATQ
ncbi:hypothetical protein [Nesterenkonia rhizosphaerae]|uniref:Uncharacterized protein n=1 Tax=Nesterenkonia rhizosphaerae TaxID=1348272 RepID=A0ABP9FU38_9MICC